MYVKDLRVINRDLKDVVLIDNASYSFGFNINNGIAIYDKKNVCFVIFKIIIEFYIYYNYFFNL